VSFFFIPLLVSIAFLLRIGLILVGLLKGPILRTFEKYGDDETVYYPLPSLLLWGGILVLSASTILGQQLAIFMPSWLIGVGMIGAGYLAYTHPEIPRSFPQIFMIYPRWYYELRERTSRYERRRLAYMWLWLPPRLRLIYDGSDTAFNQWADLVILATMRYEDNPEQWQDVPVNANTIY